MKANKPPFVRILPPEQYFKISISLTILFGFQEGQDRQVGQEEEARINMRDRKGSKANRELRAGREGGRRDRRI